MKNYIDLVSEARYWKKQAQQTDVRSEYFHYAAKRYAELNEEIKQMEMIKERLYNDSQIGNYKGALDQAVKKGKRDISELAYTYIQVFKYIAFPVLLIFLLIYFLIG